MPTANAEHQGGTAWSVRLPPGGIRLAGALAAILTITVVVIVLLGAGFRDARSWVVDDAAPRWRPGLSDGLPYRPPQDLSPRSLRDWSPDLPDRVQISHDFQIASRTPQAMTLLLPAVEGDADLFVNGVPVEEAASLRTRHLALSFSRSAFWEVPAHFLRPGANRLDVVVSGSRHRSLSAPLVLGQHSGGKGLHDTMTRLVERFRVHLLPLSALAAGLALAAGIALRAPTPWVALSAAAAAVGTRAVASDLDFLDRTGPFGPVLDQFTLAAALVCLGCAFAHRQSGASRRVRRLFVAGTALFVVLLGLAVAGAWQGVGALAAAGLGLPCLGMIFLVGTGRRALADPNPVSAPERALEGAVSGALGLATTAAVVGASGLPWGLWVPGLETAYGLSIIALLAGLAVVAALSTTREIWRWARDRPRLSRIIRSQQQEIEAAALALQQQARRSAILEERQRLSRDMHDGIGGQLMSLLARVRSDRITPEQLEGELTSGLSELRLMVDSLDASDGPVADALAVLRSRIRTQTEAAHIALDWSQSEALNDIAADPNWVLNLNRLIQEAVTNAIRHSSADQLGVAIEVAGDRRLAVTIKDNGVGFDRARVRAGRGLTNLAYRAAQMGGRIEIGRDGPGGGAVITAVVTIPQTEAAPPATGPQSSDEIMPS